MMGRITTCIGCHYFTAHWNTGTMRCANSVRTWSNGIDEKIEDIQIECPYWTEKTEPRIEAKGEIYEQLTMF